MSRVPRMQRAVSKYVRDVYKHVYTFREAITNTIILFKKILCFLRILTVYKKKIIKKSQNRTDRKEIKNTVETYVIFHAKTLKTFYEKK